MLIGDSITYGYQDKVRELLKGSLYVDYLATSYSADSEIYWSLIKAFFLNNNYDILHFNNGLHGFHMSKNTYKNSISKILFNLKAINPNLKIILALSTVVYERDSNNIDEKWNVKINERNLAMSEIASDNGYVINDLNIVSKKLPLNMRKADGIHYEPCAYAVFADKVSEVLKAHL